MHEGGDGKNRKTFPCIPDEPSKPQNFSPSNFCRLRYFVPVYTPLDLCNQDYSVCLETGYICIFCAHM